MDLAQSPLIMSKVEYIQQASPQKLPFLHSRFKPSGKFAKSFGGCKRFSKRTQVALQNEASTTRLPRITYDAQDVRESPPAFGSMRRGARREYPGFTGHTKIRRSTKKSQPTSQAPSHNLNNSSGSLTLEDDRFRAFDSPRVQRDKAATSSLSNLNVSKVKGPFPRNDWSRSQTSAKRRRDERLGNIVKKAPSTENQTTSEGKDPNNNMSSLLQDVDSLFICDDDDDGDNDTNRNGANGQTSPLEKQATTTTNITQDAKNDKDLHITFAESTSFREGDSSEDEAVMNDPFAKNFSEKLREIRGKSGMKRDRERKRLQQKKRDAELRPLGDVITNKRLHELLSPHNPPSMTIRLHS